MIIRCEDVVLDFVRYEATRAGAPVHLRPKIFTLLGYLMERRERVVLKQEIHDYLWAGQVVSESALDTSIKEARRLFGDTGVKQRVIKTIRGRGFLFVGGVEMLASAATRGPVRHEAVIERPQEPRGQPEEPYGERPPLARTVSRFVGRQRDLDALASKLELVERGQGRVVGIVGEAGSGKTRLFDELRRRNSHVRYVRGRCRPQVSGAASLLVQDMLRECCEISPSEDRDTVARKLDAALRRGARDLEGHPDWSAFLLRLLDLGAAPELDLLGPRALELKTFEALYKVLLEPKNPIPVVVEIDDLHWIDSYSEAWLAWLQRGIMGSPILLLAAYRPGYIPSWSGRSYVTQIALDPLSDADSRALVEDLLMRDQSAVVSPIVARAMGNPFFLEELSKAYRDGAAPAAAVIPGSVMTLLLARITRLSSKARAVLGYMSVIGIDAEYAQLQSLTGLTDLELQEQLETLMDGELVVERARGDLVVYSFHHSLIRDAAYQTIPEDARKNLHAQVARVLSAEHQDVVEHYPELLAHHFAEAGMGEEFAHYWLRANERALKLRFVEQASRYLQQGLGVLEALPASVARDQQELSLRVNLAGALNMSGTNDDADITAIIGRAEELRDRLPESPSLFWVLSSFVRHYLFRGDMRQALRMTERLRECGDRLGIPELMRVAAVLCPTYLAMIELYMGAPARSLEYATSVRAPRGDKMLTLSTSVYLHDPIVLCRAYAGAASLMLGKVSQSHEHCAAAIERARALPQPWNLAAATSLSADVHILRRDLESASRYAELGDAVCIEHGLQTYGMFAKGLLGFVLCARGDAAGLAPVQASLAYMKRSGWSFMRTSMLVHYAEALASLGRGDEGLGALAEAESLFESHGERHMEPEVYRLRGELLLARGQENTALALALFRQALETARARGMRFWELRAAVSLCRLSREQELVRTIYESFDDGLDTPDLVAAKALLSAPRAARRRRS